MTTSDMLPARVTGLTLAEAMPLAEVLAKSGFFLDARDPAKAIVKIMLGAELGITPITAMTSIHAIESKQGTKMILSVHAMAALIKRSQRYDYKVIQRTPKIAELEFFRLDYPHGELRASSLGTISYTWEQAIKARLAGKDNYQCHPADMLYSRAMSAGVKTFCPDVLHGDIYTDGDFPDSIDVEARVVPTAQVQTVQAQVVKTETEGTKPRAYKAGVTIASQVHDEFVKHEEKAETAAKTLTESVSVKASGSDSHVNTELSQSVATGPDADPLGSTPTLSQELGIEPGSSDLAPDKDPLNELIYALSAVLPIDLSVRIANLEAEDTRLSGEDPKDVNGHITEILGKPGAASAWKSVGVKPGKGAIVTKGHVRALVALVAANGHEMTEPMTSKGI